MKINDILGKNISIDVSKNIYENKFGTYIQTLELYINFVTNEKTKIFKLKSKYYLYIYFGFVFPIIAILILLSYSMPYMSFLIPIGIIIMTLSQYKKLKIMFDDIEKMGNLLLHTKLNLIYDNPSWSKLIKEITNVKSLKLVDSFLNIWVSCCLSRR